MAKLFLGTREVTPAVYKSDEIKIDRTLVNGTLSNGTEILDFTKNNITAIANGCFAFAYYNNQTISGNVDLSNVITAGTYSLSKTFYGCSNITSVDLSNLTGIVGMECCDSMCYNCDSLTSLDLKSVKKIYGDKCAYQMCMYADNLESIDLSSLEEIGTTSYNENTSFSGLYMAFMNCRSINTAIDFSKLKFIRGAYACGQMFNGCRNIPSADLRSLTAICSMQGAAQMFAGNDKLASVNLSSLTTISGSNACMSMFDGCDILSNVSLPALTTVSGGYTCRGMFSNCTSLTSMTFPSLNSINSSYAFQNMFSGCTSLTSLSFPALTSSSFGTNRNQFQYIISGVTGCTIHFPSNFDPDNPNKTFDVTTLAGYPNFGGTNTALAYDLTATE